MNIIKGIDRIAFAVAIIATVLAFIAGSIGYHESEKVTLIKSRETGEYIPYRSTHRGYPEWTIHPEKYIWEYKTPPLWQTMLVGVAGAGCTFLVMLFGIRLTTRGIKRFSLWIIDGFKDDKKTKE